MRVMDRIAPGAKGAGRSAAAAMAAVLLAATGGVGLAQDAGTQDAGTQDASAGAPSGSAPANAPGAGAATPGCALSGSPNVFVEGASMLRLGDVQGCPGLRWEIIPGVFINDQPAVRVLPKEDCPTGGAVSVTVGGAPATRQGDAGC